MKTNKLFLSILAVFSLSAAACRGGDDSDKGVDSGGAANDSGFEDKGSGVDGSKALAYLNTAERQALCDYRESLESATNSHKFICLQGGIIQAKPEAECEMDYAACIAKPFEVGFHCLADDYLPDCAENVTVAEVEECARHQANLLRNLVNNLSCTSDISDLSPFETLPPSCQAIEAKCPGAY